MSILDGQVKRQRRYFIGPCAFVTQIEILFSCAKSQNAKRGRIKIASRLFSVNTPHKFAYRQFRYFSFPIRSLFYLESQSFDGQSSCTLTFVLLDMLLLQCPQCLIYNSHRCTMINKYHSTSFGTRVHSVNGDISIYT